MPIPLVRIPRAPGKVSVRWAEHTGAHEWGGYGGNSRPTGGSETSYGSRSERCLRRAEAPSNRLGARRSMPRSSASGCRSCSASRTSFTRCCGTSAITRILPSSIAASNCFSREFGTALPTMLATHAPNSAPTSPEPSTVDDLPVGIGLHRHDDDGAEDEAEQRAEREPDLRTMDQVGFLQVARLVQALHRGPASREEMNVTLFDPREQQVVHHLSRARKVRHDEIESATHDVLRICDTRLTLYGGCAPLATFAANDHPGVRKSCSPASHWPQSCSDRRSAPPPRRSASA